MATASASDAVNLLDLRPLSLARDDEVIAAFSSSSEPVVAPPAISADTYLPLHGERDVQSVPVLNLQLDALDFDFAS
eukprot:m.78530 g.78530  ORF g.78530 m.78530 type:complete len:77 (+) comp50584_c0_seq1:1177-1407(+)